MPSRPHRLALIVLACAMLAGGCKGKTEGEQTRGSRGEDQAAQGAASGHGQAAGAAGAAGTVGAGAAPRQAREPIDAGAIDFEAARQARRAAALAAARPMTIQAATGGVYRSADGKVQVMIPPGALAANAVVRFWTVDTTALPRGPLGPVGLVIDGDWGDARFEPGARVTFKAPVDERFVKAVARAGGDLGALGVSRDSQGRQYLMVSMTVDEAGRPDSSSRTPVGGGQVLEAARLPVNFERVEYKKIAQLDPDPLPAAPAGVKTLEPLAVSDAFVRRYPGAPADKYHGAEMAPVRFLSQGERKIRVRESLPATMADDPAMVTCTFNPCDVDPLKPLEEAIRLNAAISAQRQPPDGLRARTKTPDLGCPPDREPTPRPDPGLRRLDASTAPGASSTPGALGTPGAQGALGASSAP